MLIYSVCSFMRKYCQPPELLEEAEKEYKKEAKEFHEEEMKKHADTDHHPELKADIENAKSLAE